MKATIPTHIVHLTATVITDLLAEQGLSKEHVEEINIPGSVEVIGACAFYGYKNLKRVTIEKGVQRIQSAAFCRSKIESITIPGSVQVIEENACSYCSDLKHITLQEGVAYIGKDSFRESNLESIIIPGSVDEIAEFAFHSSKNLKYVTIESGAKSVGKMAFTGTKLEKLVIPGSVKTISEHAFSGHKNLKYLIIEAGVESIGKLAFTGTKLEAITIPGSVRTIGVGAFGDCENLKDVTIEPGVECIGERAFEETGLQVVIVPVSVKEIKQNAFKKCNQLKTLVLPTAYAENGENFFVEMGLNANVQVIYCDDFKQEVEEKLNIYNNCLKQKDRLELHDLSQYSTQQLRAIWQLLYNEQGVDLTVEQSRGMAKTIASMSCQDGLNLSKKFPKPLASISWISGIPRMGHLDLFDAGSVHMEWKLVDNLVLVCQSQDFGLRAISLAWLSPFLTVKEMAKIIITMLTSEGGRKQITNSISAPAITSTSIGGQIEKKTCQQDLGESACKEKKDSCKNEQSRQENRDAPVTNIGKTLAG